MSIITREQLRERAQAKVKSLEFSITQTAFADSRAELEEELDLARIALASLEAEAVAFVMADDLKDSSIISTPAYRDLGEAMERTVGDVVALYTAPPAPVAVPECFKRLLHHAYGMTMGHDWNKGTMAGHHRAKLCQAVEECRNAMLRGAEPVKTVYKLPPHIYRELVNRLRDTAVKYQGCQQLREQLSRALHEVVEPAAPQQEVKP